MVVKLHTLKRFEHAPFKSSQSLMNYITQPTISGRVTGSLFYFGLYQSHCLRDSLVFLGLQIQIRYRQPEKMLRDFIKTFNALKFRDGSGPLQRTMRCVFIFSECTLRCLAGTHDSSPKLPPGIWITCPQNNAPKQTHAAPAAGRARRREELRRRRLRPSATHRRRRSAPRRPGEAGTAV